MNKESYKNFAYSLVKKAKVFVTSKDLFIFLFFLVLTTVMWSLQSLSRVQKSTIGIPLIYEDLPEGFCQSENLCDTLFVEVEGRGWNLLPHYFRSLTSNVDPIRIKTKSYSEGSNIVGTKKYVEDAKELLGHEISVLSVHPDVIDIRLSKIVSKKVPVALNAEIRPYSQYINMEPVLSPSHIVIEGTKESLDKIDTVFTVKSDDLFYDIKDVFKDSVDLDFGKNIVSSQKKVEVEVVVEQYTEKIIETVAINVVGVPSSQKLRVFPSTAKVICKTALSNWKNLGPSHFTLAVDYQDVDPKSDKVKIKVLQQSANAFDVKVVPETVEYILDDFGAQ